MTEQRLAEIAARCESVAGGKWAVVHRKNCRDGYHAGCAVVIRFSPPLEGVVQFELATMSGGGLSVGPRATFIQKAHSDIPALLNEVKRLQAENAQLKRDAACFAALYEMSELHLIAGKFTRTHRWEISVIDDSNPGNQTKDIERFRNAIEAQIPA